MLMTRLKFAAVGDNCIDRFGPPLSQSLVGGNAVNVAVQLARLGHTALYFGAVGDDTDGRRTSAALAANGVDVTYLRKRPGITAYTDIQITPSGERIFVHEDFGACAGYMPDDAETAVLKTMDHVHIGWLDDGGALRRTLAAAGVSISQDISVNADPANLGIAGLSVVFASAGDDHGKADAMLRKLLDDGAPLAVVTRGSDGSIAGDGHERVEIGSLTVPVVDTTGAGDSFIAGFLAARIAKRSLSDCLTSGRDHAALTCTHVGGFPQEPQPF